MKTARGQWLLPDRNLGFVFYTFPAVLFDIFITARSLDDFPVSKLIAHSNRGKFEKNFLFILLVFSET